MRISWRLIFSLFWTTASIAQAGTPPISFSFDRRPIQIDRIVENVQVLLVADDHTQVEIKSFLTHHLLSLQASGFNCLAVEMLPDGYQTHLDRWGTSDKEKVLAHLRYFWAEKGPGIADAYFNLIDSAKRRGWMVIAMDPSQMDTTNRQQVNPAWTNCIMRCLKDHKRIVVFGGASHFRGHGNSVSALLAKQQVSIATIEFSTPDDELSVGSNLLTYRLLKSPIPELVRFTEENRRAGISGSFMSTGTTYSSRWNSSWYLRLDPAQELASSVSER